VDGYLDADERPYVHLLDGGIADNIGLRVPLDNVALTGGLFARMRAVGVEPFDHVAVIVVNAEVRPKAEFGLAAASPGLASILGSVSNIQIYGRNADTIELMRGSLKRWATEMASMRGGRPMGTSLVTLGFEDIEDPEERKFFQSLPTSFSLPDTTVDRLIAVARRLLRESPDYQAFLAALAADAPAP
jgi:NTE family protein